MNIAIRPMTLDDAEGKGYVHWQAWREAYDGLLDPDYLNERTLAECVDMARHYPGNTMVAVQQERVIGFGVYGESRDADTAGYGELFALYVLKEYYGHGIGFRLMSACMEQLTERPGVVLWVLEGNARAMAFYERFGFRPDGTRKEVHLGTPCTELRMVLRKQHV